MSRPQTPAYAVRRPQLNTSVGSNFQTSRSATPLSRTVISLEEWEAKAPLTDEQVQSISLVKEKLGTRPLPEKFAETSAQGAARLANGVSGQAPPWAPLPARVSDLLSTSQAGHRALSPSARSSVSGTPGTSASASPNPGGSSAHLHLSDPLHPVTISTPQQFQDHFAALTLYTEHEQDSLYRDQLAEITGLKEKCQGLIEVLKEGEVEVGDMLKALEYVEERSESLRGACEDLLEEQTHLLTHTSQLAHRLTFFTFLDAAQRMLNNPDHELVLSEGFLPMVKRLDECLGYLGEHRDFKDSELYLIRYQQCMTRSMALIKIYFVNTIRLLGQDVYKRVTEQKSLSETAIQALIYTKFTSLSEAIRPLLSELEQRALSSPDELSSLLGECHSAWVSTRQTLLSGRVSEEVGRMEPERSDLVDLTRAGCGYLKQVCLDEFNLFKHFFLSGEAPLYGFLEGLCDHLYDHLRPRILHEPSLETLCGVCTVLQALMVQDLTSARYDEDIEELMLSPDGTPGSPMDTNGNGNGYEADYFSQADESFSSRQRRTGSVKGFSNTGSVIGKMDGGSLMNKRDAKRKPLSRLHTEVLLRMVLHDAQTRLVFRAQAMLRADVEYYVPKEADLDYPQKVKGQAGGQRTQRQVAISLDPDDDDEPAFLSLPPVNVQETWYPTLRVTLWILSCLYTYIESAVFDDLAQEAVVNCRRSLTLASEQLANKKGQATLMDARLFLVRHLLILKEMTGGLELGRRDRQRDWQGISDFLRTLLDTASTMLGYAKGSIVRSGEVIPDAKSDVDRTLKIACEDVIQQCSKQATLPLTRFLDKCTAYLSSRPSSSADLSSQSFATAEKVMEVHKEFKDGLRDSVEAWREQLMMYLQDEETVKVLVPPAHNTIVDAYRQFHDLIRAEYDFSTAAAIMTPAAVHTLLTQDSQRTEQ